MATNSQNNAPSKINSNTSLTNSRDNALSKIISNTSQYSSSHKDAQNYGNDGVLSWADVLPDPVLTDVNVDTLNPAKILDMAQKFFEGNIDGKSGGGSRTLKEGEEKFIHGAGYTGIKGINITEVSGISASIVHGKNVSWTKGDVFVCIDGNQNISRISVNQLDSKINATGTINLASSAGGAIQANLVAGGEISTNVECSENNVFVSAAIARTTQTISTLVRNDTAAVQVNNTVRAATIRVIVP
jgi:hypothetical protein